MAAKAIPEEEILRERDPAFEYSSDDWPEFELKDAKVHHREDPTQLTSLLEATAYYPLTLTGFLQPLPKAQAHLQLKPTTQRAPLIEISDVRTFSYGQFEDGNIGLWAGGKAGWYALKPARGYRSIWNEMVQSVDIFYWIVDAYREERRGSDRKNAQLLPEYTVEELFDKYAEEVIEDSHGRDEAAQVLYEHKDFLLASMLAGKEGIAWAKNPLYTHLSQRFPEEHAVIKSRLTGRAVPARYARQASVNSEASNLKRKRARPGREASEGITSTRENSTTDVATQQQLASRRSRRNQRDSADTDTPEPEYSTPQRSDELHRRSMKGRSALRPKASKASKGASKGGKAPVPNFVDDDDDEDDPAISPTAAKRRHSNHSAQIRSHNRSRKDDLDEGIDIPSSPEQEESTPSDTHPGAVDKDSSDEDEEDAEPGTDLALRLKHEPDPIQEDTWVCALDGCTHKVYQASLVDSQRLIREHYALHAYDDDERVQLVKKLQHPSLPVGHLMERVRLQARTEGFPASRSALEGANAHSRYRPAPQVRY